MNHIESCFYHHMHLPDWGVVWDATTNSLTSKLVLSQTHSQYREYLYACLCMCLCVCPFMSTGVFLNCESRTTHSSGRLHIDHAELALLLNKTAHSLIYHEHSLHYCHSHLTPVPDTHKDSHIPLAYPRRLKSAGATSGDLGLKRPVKWRAKVF